MKVSGFSFVRNAIKYDYPYLESLVSILPICDEFILAVGNSDDATLDKLHSLNSPKLKILQTVWDDSLRVGGKILAQQTNIALSHATGDWAFYLQADEVVHENDLATIVRAMEQYADDATVEGLLFSYRHFYGSYDYIGDSRRWYRHEIRVVRNGIRVQSWGDAQGFSIGERKLRVKAIDVPIYHYGWVKSPQHQQAKQQSFNKLWHSDQWVKENVGNATEFDYSFSGRLKRFTGAHPSVMRERIAKQDWEFRYAPEKSRIPLKEKMLDAVESLVGIRIGEYKNYERV